MELSEVVRSEWRDLHYLTRAALAWIEAHGDAGDPHPVATAVAQLRAEG